MLTKLLEGDKGPVKDEGRKRTVRRSRGGVAGGRAGSRGEPRSYREVHSKAGEAAICAAIVYTKQRSDLLP